MNNIVPVAADSSSLLIHGKRQFIISGEIHYPRVPVAEWPRVLDRTKEAGINCVASYVFWGVHEPREGIFDFSGNANLGAFLTLCRERELACIVRMGPYCCAEWNYGGFPAWLRDVPGICFRTWNKPYIERVKNYFRVLAAQLVPHLATQGGNVILVQVENEYNNVARRYGAGGSRYLAWIVDYVKSLGIDVPTVTCEGGAPGAIEAMNGFTVHETAVKHRQKHPAMPLLWTELWPAWYDTWGYEHHVRDPYEIGYELLRFVAVGGAGFNYYMWHGGTNFGRSTMYLQASSYEFGGPLNEWGEPTAKSKILSALHRCLVQLQDLLLGGERGEEFRSADGKAFSVMWRLGHEACGLTINTADEARELSCEIGQTLRHPAKSACLWQVGTKGGEPLWKSWPDGRRKKSSSPAVPRWKPVVASTPWRVFAEPRPAARRDATASSSPIEQLLLTRDASDYCWYATEVSSADARCAELEIARGGDFFYVFVNDRLVDWTRQRLEEIRGPTLSSRKVGIIPANPLEESVLKSGANGYGHTFKLSLQPGKNRIEILACALGLIKGDWQLALSMQYERKGIWDDVLLEGKKLRGWRHYPGLVGEKQRLSQSGAEDFTTVPWTTEKKRAPLTWCLQEFELPARRLDPQFVWAFDATGLAKGMLWLNGHAVGRVWQIPAHGMGADPLPPVIGLTGAGSPTQRYYRIPASWLLPKNRLLFFSETGAIPSPKALVSRLYQATSQ